jgi:hypothetical protein
MAKTNQPKNPKPGAFGMEIPKRPATKPKTNGSKKK